MDGTDFLVLEDRRIPWSYRRQFYSSKLGGAAFRYIIGTHVETGEIVYLSDCYPGAASEPNIIIEELNDLMEDGEKFMADRLYRHYPDHFIVADAVDNEYTRRFNSIRSKVERRIGRVKKFGIFVHQYRGRSPTIHARLLFITVRIINYVC